MSLHPNQIKILQAIQNGSDSSAAIAAAINLPIDVVIYYLGLLNEEGCLQYLRSLGGEDNTMLLNKGKVALTNPDLLSQRKENRASVSQTFNSPIHGGVAGNVEGNQIIYSSDQRQNLAEAAKEIQQLLNQLSETYPTTTSAGQMAIATKAVEEIEQNPALKQRVIGALKAGGTEALKEMVDHPAVNILLAVLEGWQKPE